MMHTPELKHHLDSIYDKVKLPDPASYGDAPGPMGETGPRGPRCADAPLPTNVAPLRLSADQVQQLIAALTTDKDLQARLAAARKRTEDVAREVNAAPP